MEILSDEVRSGVVAVTIFENQTLDPSMEVFGGMISDWITTRLMESESANVVSTSVIREQMPLLTGERPSVSQFADVVQANYLISGRYYYIADELSIFFG